MMTKVKNIIDQKRSEIISVSPSDKVERVLTLMRDHRVRSILVTENKQLVGIVSQGDCAIKVLLPNLSPEEVSVSQIMTSNPLTVSLDNSIDECMAIMVHKHIRHLPVLDKEKLIGVISIGDIVKNIIEVQGSQIEFLENYIKGVRMV
jgi:CBS domain-containing protein